MIEIVGLFILSWLAYAGAVNNGFIIDDIEGIMSYDGHLIAWRFDAVMKWLWHRLFQKEPRKHHFFSILIQSANVVLLYLFLSTLFTKDLALFTSILFAIHPINTQSVAWVSGRGYPTGLFYTLLGLNLLKMYLPSTLTIPLFGLLEPHTAIIIALAILGYLIIHWFAVESQFTAMFTSVILAYLGYLPLAMVTAVLSGVLGVGIIKQTIGDRTETFKKQNMGRSTMLHPRKFIVVCKTLYYYTKLCLFPKRLGLYHKFCYHYSDDTEKEDKHFWAGFAILIGFGMLFWFGNSAVKLGVVWYLSYICIFLNWITIHQFVAERYTYFANIGLCLIVCNFLLPYPIVFAVLCGLAIMRLWTNLPSFLEEVPFYQSNIWNFPRSEVAFANLGVVYMKRGLVGSAVDMWLIGTKINASYDVAWYNLSSTMKTKGDLPKALEFLQNAVKSPTCHFKELWGKELIILEKEVVFNKELQELVRDMGVLSRDPSKVEEVEKIRVKVEKMNNLVKILEEEKKKKLYFVQQQQSSLEIQTVKLQQMSSSLSTAMPQEELIKMRDSQWFSIKQDALGLLQKRENTEWKEVKSEDTQS